MTDQELAKLFRDAVSVIERDGWCRGYLTDIYGHRCAAGGIREALGLSAYPGNSYAPILTVWDSRFRHLTARYSLIGYNDHPDRTMSEVVGVLLAAAEELDPQGALIAEPVNEPQEVKV